MAACSENWIQIGYDISFSVMRITLSMSIMLSPIAIILPTVKNEDPIKNKPYKN